MEKTFIYNNTKNSKILGNKIKIAVLHKSIYRFSTIQIGIPAGSFAEIHKPVLKFTWKCEVAET